MYQYINTDGKTVAFSDEVRFIRQNAASGAFIEATEDTAQGVVVSGAPYSLMGRVALPGAADTVSVTLLTDEEAVAAQAKAEREREIEENKAYLTATDYIVLKITEAMAEGDTDEVTALQNLYAPELAKRKTARATINGLQAENDLAE